MDRELEILRTTRLAEWGPTLRDRGIHWAIFFEGESARGVARQMGLAVRTVLNISRMVHDRVARVQAAWRRMSLEELLDEEERLRGLAEAGLNRWHATGTATRRFESRSRVHEITGPTPSRNLKPVLAVERICSTLDGLTNYIDRRVAELLAPASPPKGARGTPVRTCRRKSLTGRVLRLPLSVRARPARRLADGILLLTQSPWTSKTWVRRVGIPPPDASRDSQLDGRTDGRSVEGLRCATIMPNRSVARQPDVDAPR